MAGEDDYFGYTTGQNEQLTKNRQMARHMGEDIRYYPAPESGDYIEPTRNWDTEEGRSLSSDEEKQAFYKDSIEKIYKRIMGQDASVVRQLADRWYQVNQVLDDLRSRVLNAATKVRNGSDGGPGGAEGWTGPGAEAFLARGPGATIKSIDDWEQAAITNWLGTLALAGVIETRQAEMARLWERYTSSMVTASDQWLKSKGYESIDDLVPGTPGADQYITAMRDRQLTWNWQAQKVQYGMAKDYWSVMSEELAGGRATVYEGPTDAVRENPEFIARHKMGDIGVPHITPPTIKPNVKKPDVTVPDVKPDVTKPDITVPDVKPDITKPDIGVPVVEPQLTTTDIGQPNITTPVVPPPVMPPAVPGGQATGGPPVGRPATLPAGLGKGLLNNLPGGNVSSVLRSNAGAAPTGEGLPPSAPQPPRAGQAPPAPQIKGRGPGQGAPGGPQGKRGPGESEPAAPGTVSKTEQFGGPPPGAPSSPVLRNPRVSGPGQRRAIPGPRTGGGAPVRSDAAPPVLGRPRPAAPTSAPPPGRRSSAPDNPAAPVNPLAPPPLAGNPVVGRSARHEADAPATPEPSSGVVRGKRSAGAAGYEGQLGSRKVSAQEPQVSGVDQEFDKVRRILDQEGAWTVETPGGGVVDGAPARSSAPAAEPKPTLGA